MSASDDINYLIGYWTKSTGWLAGAIDAMTNLVAEARVSSTRALFAANSIFETAMIADQVRTPLTTPVVGPGGADMMKVRSPRQIMLDGIYEAATGGWFGVKDPTGITTWLHSVDVSAGAVAGTLKGDPDPEVRAAMLKILRDVAIPEYWGSFLKTQRVFETLNAQLPTTTWDQYHPDADLAARKVLLGLSASAEGRVESDLARYAMDKLPAFPTGDGKMAPTLPPNTPWYRNGRLVSAGVLGLLGGGLFAARR